ncbi:MAG TPA: hypothetical protein VHX14_24010 [Thermoanaerobaculia bacterium]|jgi:hypothetical protein|nr:hypothetical protein [Thermoanaerobaculia bacterium]
MSFNRSSCARLFAVITLTLALSAIPLFAAPPLPGAIFTTDGACNGTDLNIYASKLDVFVNGGPAHPGAAGLPDGRYFLRVTEPNGAQLGNPPRDGSNNPIAMVTVAGGRFVQCYNLQASVVKQSDGSTGYDDTTNSGGEYKVWVSTTADFINSSTKTDNFKVRSAPVVNPGHLHVLKFYDANANGRYDAGETLIAGWQVAIADQEINWFDHSWTDYIRSTPVDLVGDTGTYHAGEVMPSEANWRFIAATATDGSMVITNHVDTSIADGDDKTIRFGNLCLGAGGGLTLGYWSNKNGQSSFNRVPNGLAMLVALNLRNGAGANFDPANYNQIHDWLLSGNAVNMAYMLSVQMTAMTLNVASGGVNGSRLLYAPGTHSANQFGYASVNDILGEANASLGANGSTPDGSPVRTYQEALKNALDAGNNNLNFVQTSPCGFSFAQ